MRRNAFCEVCARVRRQLPRYYDKGTSRVHLDVSGHSTRRGVINIDNRQDKGRLNLTLEKHKAKSVAVIFRGGASYLCERIKAISGTRGERG